MTTFSFGYEETMNMDHIERMKWLEFAGRYRKETADAQTAMVQAMLARGRKG